MVHSSSNPNSILLSTRPDVVPMFNFRVTHLFSKKIGWYANVQMLFYKEKKSAFFDSNKLSEAIDDFFDALFRPVARLHPSFEAGLVYRIEKNRWKVHPSIGLAYGAYLSEHTSSSSTTSGGQVKEGFSYKQPISPFYLGLGVSTNYFVSKRSYLSLKVNFQQPLGKTSAEFIQIEDGVETKNMSYKTSTAGRNLNLSLGYGFTFGKNRK